MHGNNKLKVVECLEETSVKQGPSACDYDGELNHIIIHLYFVYFQSILYVSVQDDHIVTCCNDVICSYGFRYNYVMLLIMEYSSCVG